MRGLDALWIAFATYSRIPVPSVSWDERAMRYSICYFPLVGVPIALLEALVWYACVRLDLGVTLRGACMSAVPILVTGGIHLDGFCDTSDALSSYQSRERRLEILKDSHVGAFALIRVCTYLTLYFGAVATLDSVRSVATFGLAFCIERALSGLSVVTFKSARKDGMLYSFSSVAERRTVVVVMALYLVAGFVAMWLISWKACAVNLALSVAVLAYYYRTSYRAFGGITGDVAGYFLQLCELALLFGTALTQG